MLMYLIVLKGIRGVINKLWADMSEKERQQVRGILE